MKWRNTTRGGHPVRIYAEDCWNNEIHGSVNVGGGWRLCAWDKHGEALEHMGPPGCNLIPATPIIDWSKQPDWVKAVAMDCYRRWIRCDGVPQQKEFDGLWGGVGVFIQPMHRSEYPVFCGHWNDSLCVRPEKGDQP